MMKSLLAALLATLLGLAVTLPSMALETSSQDAGPGLSTQATAAGVQACPQTADGRLDLAGFAQSDCCKGHKGVCGCRAGKIICCDGTASETCTCHGDGGFLN